MTIDMEYITSRLREVGATCRMPITKTETGLRVDCPHSGREYTINRSKSGKTFRVNVDGEAVSGNLKNIDNAIDALRKEVVLRNYLDNIDTVFSTIYTP